MEWNKANRNYCLPRVSRHLIRNMDLLRKKRKGVDEELVKTEETTDADGGKGEVKEDVNEISDVNQKVEEEQKE